VNEGFRREVAENCALLGYYAVSSGILHAGISSKVTLHLSHFAKRRKAASSILNGFIGIFR
jgi:hypothetical protein